MPPTRAPARTRCRGAALLLAACVSALCIPVPVWAQDAAPDAGAPAEAARPKPKPKPKPVHKAAPAPAASPAAPGPAAAVWPAGASSVSESYGDWSVSCVRPSEQVSCIVVQSQGDSATGRRKFGLELGVPKDGRAEGVILMPFGLALEPGVTFKLDEQTLGKGAPYSTCNNEGCLVPISFPTLATDGMRTAKTLTVTAQKPNSTDPATITVPLVGFPQAFDRAIALVR